MRLQVERTLFEETFALFRHCGAGERECQAFWIGSWANPMRVDRMAHPAHTASAVHSEVDDSWTNALWIELADRHEGLRAQIHTHPGAAYHSPTDDAFPIVSSAGFLSLVIPRFAMGPVSFGGAFLAQMDDSGRWQEVSVEEHIEVTS